MLKVTLSACLFFIIPVFLLTLPCTGGQNDRYSEGYRRVQKKRISLRFFRIFDYSMLRDTSSGDERRKLGVSLAQIYLTKHRINK